MPETIKIHIEADIEIAAEIVTVQGIDNLVEFIEGLLQQQFEGAENVSAQIAE